MTGRDGKVRGSLVITLLCGACSGAPPQVSPTDVLTAAAEAMGTDAALAELGPIAVYATGTLDKAAEGQGFSPFVPAPAPFRETLAADLTGSATRWEYREERYDGTSEAFGEAHPGPDRKTLLIHALGIAVPFRNGPDFDQDRAKIRRRFPHVLVREMLERPEELRYLGEHDGGHRLRGTLGEGDAVTVAVDISTSFVTEVSYEQTVPGRGPATLRWWYGAYDEVAPGVWVPHEYGSTVGDLEYTTLSVDSVRRYAHARFDETGELRALAPRDAESAAGPAPLQLRELAPGLFTVPDVRGGFAPLVAEFDTFLVVVDAPASFPLLGQLPAGETDPASSMSWHSERLVDRLGERWPDKAISYVVLTHHHEDHVGGVRAFVAAGATVLGPASAVAAARRLAVLPPGATADRLDASPRAISAEAVAEPRRIGDGTRWLDLLPVGENPHADGMLVVSVPAAGVVYVSDLATPGPVARYPAPNHEALDRFFGRWLSESGLDPDAVWSMHAGEPLSREHLERLASDPDMRSAR